MKTALYKMFSLLILIFVSFMLESLRYFTDIVSPFFLENYLLEFPKYITGYIFTLPASLLEKVFCSLLIQMKSAQLYCYYLNMLRMNF